jgi:two-component system OmpR family response regulator
MAIKGRHTMPIGRVLVVDDEAQVCEMVRDALVEFGYEVAVAGGGHEAFGLMASFDPDAVLLDVLMPGMPGAEVLSRLRQEYPDVAVVMLTGNQDEGAARQLLANGALDYVRKPFDLQVLERVMAAAVASRRS